MALIHCQYRAYFSVFFQVNELASNIVGYVCGTGQHTALMTLTVCSKIPHSSEI
jgi:hypothetical protein